MISGGMRVDRNYSTQTTSRWIKDKMVQVLLCNLCDYKVVREVHIAN